MPTTRTPIGRPPVRRITAEAITIFRKMVELEERCTCPPTDDDRYFKGECWRVRNGGRRTALSLMCCVLSRGNGPHSRIQIRISKGIINPLRMRSLVIMR
jgi:hypothetical protein